MIFLCVFYIYIMIMTIILSSIIVGFVLNEINLNSKKPKFNKKSGKYIYMQPLIGMNILLYSGKNNCIHIHHWVLNLCLIAFLYVVPKLSKNVLYALIGFNIGSLLQDMTYLLESRRKVYMSPFEFKQKCSMQLETYNI